MIIIIMSLGFNIKKTFKYVMYAIHSTYLYIIF